MSKRQVNTVKVLSKKIQHELHLAVVADLHNGSWRENADVMSRCDAILTVGDLVNRHRLGYDNASDFLKHAPELAPTFYAIGNHEWKYEEYDAFWPLVEQSSVTVLDNRFVPFGGVTLGGFSSAREPDPSFLPTMAQQPGYKLLMCHQPEWFERYVASLDIDLTVSGHAHGGQVRFFGHGLYAPGQGFFPHLTNGFYNNGRLLISRGMTNSNGLPRWNNPCELMLLHLIPEV